MIPPVTRGCETEFRGRAKVLTFFLPKAKALAADTCDGHVTFNKFIFDAAEGERVLNGDQEHVVPEPDQVAEVFLGGTFYCKVDLRSGFPNQEFSDMDLDVLDTEDEEDLGQNPMILCSSPLLPELRLLTIYVVSGTDYGDWLELDPESALTKLLRANMWLPMLFGVGLSS